MTGLAARVLSLLWLGFASDALAQAHVADEPPKAASAPARVVLLELEGAIQPAAQRYLQRGLREAARSDAALVVLRLDTPGGTVVSLRAMARAITTPEVPVVVFVAPPGARAASAGFFLLMAADVAAMAPGTNAGAAAPVSLGGEQNETASKKATEDAAALARSLAGQRGRPTDLAERAVTDARSYTASEAKDAQLVDLVADDLDALLRATDGRAVQRFGGRSAVIESFPYALEKLPPNLAERLLMLVGDPQIAYLLLLLGMLGLLIELTHPGAIVPGVIGATALLLSFYGFSLLPVSLTGVLLIGLGIAFLAAEPFVVSHGALAIAGVAAFVLGSSMLVDSDVPGFRIQLGLIVPAALLLGAISLFLLTRALRLRAAPPLTGLEGMIGEVGDVIDPVDPALYAGKVFVHGEYWDATAAEPLAAGTRVRVEAIVGHTLKVAKAEGLHTS